MNIRQLKLDRLLGTALIASVLLTGVSASGAYLGQLGVPALRWQASCAPRFALLSTLPTLGMGETRPKPLPSAVLTATHTNTPVVPSQAIPPLAPDQPLTAASSPGSPGLPYDADGLLSREWLTTMFYSPPRTNGVGTWIMPAPFIPPPPPSRSSTAAFTIGKP